MASSDLTARYMALAEQLGDESGRARGWRRRAAERLAISESTLSKMLNGTRVVGIDLAERAIERLNLDSAYFWTDKGQQASTGPRGLRSKELTELLAKFDARSANVTDVFDLARAVVDSPVFLQAQKILKTCKPQSEQKVGALFLDASRLIDLLRDKS